MELSAEKIVKNQQRLKSDRANFDSLYQDLHNYYYVESDNITTKKARGSEITKLLDTTSLDAADIAAAGLSNYLTPESSKWLFLEHPNPELRDNKEVQNWMHDTADELLYTFARSNFYNQMSIFYKSSLVYGTASLVTERDPHDNLRFYNLPINKHLLTEDARERPNAYYIQYEYTAEQAYSRFGDAVGRDVIEAYQSGANENKKFKYLCYIGQRNVYDPDKLDKLNMPIRMCWIDVANKKILKEDGFRSMPCVSHRFYKVAQEAYGYSPAMKALPHARLLNVMTDTVLRSAMKQTDPAWAIPDNAFIGRPNFNPRQINYYRRSSLSPRDEIFPLVSAGNINVGEAELEGQRQQIRKIFFNDTFQQFSELTKQMTVPEVMERINEKMSLLGPAVGRYVHDVLQPLCEKSVISLYEDGRLPRVPDVMANNPGFEVRFTSRLVQSQRQVEVQNLSTALGYVGQIAQMKPEVLDKVDGDKAIDKVFNVIGVDPEIILDQQQVDKMRQARAEMAMQQQQAAQALTEAQTYKAAAEGNRNVKDAEA